MIEEYSIERQDKCIVLTNNDKFNDDTREFETFPKTIKRVITFLNNLYPLYIYYVDHYKSSVHHNNYVILDKMLRRDLIVFEAIDLDDFNREYISERFILGTTNIKELLIKIKSNKFRSFKELNEFLELNCDFTCKIFDSAYLEVKSQSKTIIENIEKLVQKS